VPGRPGPCPQSFLTSIAISQRRGRSSGATRPTLVTRPVTVFIPSGGQRFTMKSMLVAMESRAFSTNRTFTVWKVRRRPLREKVPVTTCSRSGRGVGFFFWRRRSICGGAVYPIANQCPATRQFRNGQRNCWQIGHAAPAPHAQASIRSSLKPRQGRSGWFSQTKPVPLQVSHLGALSCRGSIEESGFRRFSGGVLSKALSAAFRERPSRARSPISLPSISAPLSRLSPGRVRGVPLNPGCRGVAIGTVLC